MMNKQKLENRSNIFTDLVKQVLKDSAYQEREPLRKTARAAAAPIIKDLQRHGVAVDELGGLRAGHPDIAAAIPILIKWLPLVEPDLANPATAEVYEIKPATDLIEGIAQVTAYIAILRVFDNAHRQWQYGSSYTPSQNPISLGNGSYAIIFPTINGVIPYKVINFPSLIGVAVAGTVVSIAEVVQDVALGSLVEAEAL